METFKVRIEGRLLNYRELKQRMGLAEAEAVSRFLQDTRERSEWHQHADLTLDLADVALWSAEQPGWAHVLSAWMQQLYLEAPAGYAHQFNIGLDADYYGDWFEPNNPPIAPATDSVLPPLPMPMPMPAPVAPMFVSSTSGRGSGNFNSNPNLNRNSNNPTPAATTISISGIGIGGVPINTNRNITPAAATTTATPEPGSPLFVSSTTGSVDSDSDPDADLITKNATPAATTTTSTTEPVRPVLPTPASHITGGSGSGSGSVPTNTQHSHPRHRQPLQDGPPFFCWWCGRSLQYSRSATRHFNQGRCAREAAAVGWEGWRWQDKHPGWESRDGEEE